MSDDLTISVHAIERMIERFGDVVEGMSDDEIGLFIYEEVIAAIEAGRESNIHPLAFAPMRRIRWRPHPKGSSIVWTEDQTRGYILQTSDEGAYVLTALLGRRNLKQAPPGL